MALLTYLNPGEDFPPTSQALEEPNGLLAAGGSLDSETLLAAYRRGIFPWYEAPQPVLWWSPDPRSVLSPDELRVSRSLKKTLRRSLYRISADRAFTTVMQACAAPREGQLGTWIDTDMCRAYTALHREGWAHSIEVWDASNALIGGLYGVAVGRAFFGESMFHRRSDASKIAMVGLCFLLRQRGYTVIDCQIESEHLNSLGAAHISRMDFENRLAHTNSMLKDTSPWCLPDSCAALLQGWEQLRTREQENVEAKNAVDNTEHVARALYEPSRGSRS